MDELAAVVVGSILIAPGIKWIGVILFQNWSWYKIVS